MKNKWQDKRGVTLIYALLAVLAVMVISALLFSSAESNYVHYANEREDEQLYLMVHCAADTLIDAMVEDKIVFQTEEVISEDGTSYENIISYYYVDNGIQMPDSIDEYKLSNAIARMAFDSYAYSYSSTSNVYYISAKYKDKVFEDISLRFNLFDDYLLMTLQGRGDTYGEVYNVHVYFYFVRGTGNGNPFMENKVSTTDMGIDGDGNRYYVNQYETTIDKENIRIN